MNIRARLGCLAVCAAFGAGAPTMAAFHFMQIEQVIGAVNGDKTAQAIQLRMRSAGQNLVSGTRVRAWDANGMNPVTLVTMGASVPNAAAGSRILIASTNFPSHTSPLAVANFTMTALIPASYLAAGSVTFEDGGGTIYWRVSWGGAAYTGAGAGSITNDADGNFNPPFGSALPTNCTQALRFPGAAGAMSTNNLADYALTPGAATVVDNAGTSYMVQACTGAGDCNDSISCTTDACSGGCCVFTADDGMCANLNFCDGVEVCDLNTGCVSPGNPCVLPTPICNETTDTCNACSVDGDCDDGVACTDNECMAGNCVYTPNNANCPPNGQFCDGVEFCHLTLGCQSPGDPCGPGTTCDEPSDTCQGVTLQAGLAIVASGLNSPVKVTHAGDGSGRLFIVEQTGQIRVVDSGGTLLGTPFLDVASLMPTLNGFYDERGLLGLAFHPNYSSNGRFFIRYSKPRTSTGTEPCDLDGFIPGCHSEVVAEYAVLGDPLTSNVADASSEQILLSVPKPQWNHNSGDMSFGPDGYLYIGMGDGGGANDGLADVPVTHGPIGNGQNKDALLGKVLRIDIDGGAPYAIPAGNPFVGVAGADEIYAMGFRNPYRFSFDRGTGDLYVGDVGQDLFEEIDVVTLGGNYGWVIREALHCFDPLSPGSPPASCPTVGADGEPLLDPISEYPHSTGGLAVVGGYVYRGTAFPDLAGLYVYGDFSADFGPTGRLYYFDPNLPPPIDRQNLRLPDNVPLNQALKGFGEDEAGEIYVCASDNVGPAAATAGPGGPGVVYRIVPPLSAPSFDPVTAKSRALSISVAATATGGPGQSAIRIAVVDLQTPVPSNPPCCPPPNFSEFEEATCTAVGESAGCARWVGPPIVVPESQDNPALGHYRYARLQCSPYYHDWSGEGVFHVGGPEIMPSSTFDVQTLSSTCKGAESTCLNVSTITTMTTRRSGDVTTPFAPTGTQPDPQDIVAVVNKFRNQPGAPVKVAAQNQPSLIDFNTDVGALDIVNTIDAFRGIAYPFSGPCPCPSLVTCGATPCTSSGQCGAGGTYSISCVKTCVGGPIAGVPCAANRQCNLCIGGTSDGTPCNPTSPTACPGGACTNDGVCPTSGFCRDRCGRCN